MTDWYRNTDWDDAIAAAFEARLKRARGKAKYLKLQGMALRDAHPEIAISLLERCVALADPVQTAHAQYILGGVHLARGEVDRTIFWLAEAIAQEAREPDVATGAPLDYAFLIALLQRTGAYDRVMAILDDRVPVTFGAAGYAHHGALAMILAHRGDAAGAAEAARVALAATLDRPLPFPGHPDAVVRQPDNPFTARLIAIVERGTG